MHWYNISIFLLSILFLSSCTENQENPNQLGYYGFHDVVEGDTVYHTIPDFEFINQDSMLVNNNTFGDKIYVSDFFFTSCPTICPLLTKQMLRIHDKYKENDELLLLSHSIDTKYDTVGRLKEYAANMGVSSDKWHFVTGDKDKIYDIAEEYMSIATENPDAPGGFDHSGWIVLIDKERHIRAYCNGTKEEEVDKFLLKIEQLSKNYSN